MLFTTGLHCNKQHQYEYEHDYEHEYEYELNSTHNNITPVCVPGGFGGAKTKGTAPSAAQGYPKSQTGRQH